MSSRFLIIFFSLQLIGAARGQNAGLGVDDSTYLQDSVQSRTDGIGAIALLPIDTVLAPRAVQIDPDTIRQLKNKKEFAYVSNLDSILKALQDKENAAAAAKPEKPRRSFMNDFLQAPILRTILMLLALFFVAVILYHLLKDQAIFRKVSSRLPTKVVDVQNDELLQNDYDLLVHQACKLSDYRMAVRYLFLKTLQELRDKNIIEYLPGKTNSRYATEIPQQWRNEFSRIVLHYEYAWYGKFRVSREQFTLIEKNYASFLQKI